jgi:hypothetical protein
MSKYQASRLLSRLLVLVIMAVCLVFAGLAPRSQAKAANGYCPVWDCSMNCHFDTFKCKCVPDDPHAVPPTVCD